MNTIEPRGLYATFFLINNMIMSSFLVVSGDLLPSVDLHTLRGPLCID